MDKSTGGKGNLDSQVGDIKLNRINGSSFLDIFCGAGCNPALRIGNSIYLFDSAFDSDSEGVYNTLHEFGHIFGKNKTDAFHDEFWEGCNLRSGGKCLTPGKPIGDVATEHSRSNPAEDFADTFAMTIWTENFDIPANTLDGSLMSSGPSNKKYPPYYATMPSVGRIQYIKMLLRPQ